MVANRLLRPINGNNTPIIDLFPEQYMTMPTTLLSSACAYVRLLCIHNLNSTFTFTLRSFVPYMPHSPVPLRPFIPP